MSQQSSNPRLTEHLVTDKKIETRKIQSNVFANFGVKIIKQERHDHGGHHHYKKQSFGPQLEKNRHKQIQNDFIRGDAYYEPRSYGLEGTHFLLKSKNIRDIVLDPSTFTIEKILMKLNVSKLQKLQHEFEVIQEQDAMSIRKQRQLLEEGEKTLGEQVHQESQKIVHIDENQDSDGDVGMSSLQNSRVSRKLNPILPRDQFFQNSRLEEKYSNQTQLHRKMKFEKQKISARVNELEQVDGLTISQFVRVMLRILATNSHDWQEGDGPQNDSTKKPSKEERRAHQDEAQMRKLQTKLRTRKERRKDERKDDMGLLANFSEISIENAMKLGSYYKNDTQREKRVLTQRQKEKRNERKIRQISERIRGLQSSTPIPYSQRNVSETNFQMQSTDHNHGFEDHKSETNKVFANELSIESETDESIGTAERQKQKEQEFQAKRDRLVQQGSAEYYDLIFGLMLMFLEIDINGDGTMEWTELMMFLLDRVNQRNQMTFDVKNIEKQKIGGDDDSESFDQGSCDQKMAEEQFKSQVSKISGASDFTIVSEFSEVAKAKDHLQQQFLKDIFVKFQRSKFIPFQESETIFDKLPHRNPIEKVLYSRKYQKYLLIEQVSASLCGDKIIVASEFNSQQLRDRENKFERRYGTFDEEQAKKFALDIFAKLGDEFSHANFEDVFNQFANEQTRVIEKAEISAFIRKLTGGEQSNRGKQNDLTKMVEKQSIADDLKENVLSIVDDYSIKLDFRKKAHILSMAWSEKQSILGVLATDGRMFFYQSVTTNLQLKLVFTIDLSDLPVQTHIWCIEKQDVWLTAGKDNILREWAITQTSKEAESDQNQIYGRQEPNFQPGLKKANNETQNLRSWSSNAVRQIRFGELRKHTLMAQQEEYFYDGFLVHVFGKETENIHTDMITDVCEVANPLVIATACMDKLIRFISLTQKRVVGIFKGQREQMGIRQLDYTTYADGYILSVGLENYVNIWSLEGGMGSIQNTMTQVRIKGKATSNLTHSLKNASHHSMRFGRFFENSSFCVTVDEAFVTKIWNFTKNEMLQTIRPQNFDSKKSLKQSGVGNMSVNDLLIIGEQFRYAIISKRMMFFDTNMQVQPKQKLGPAENKLKVKQNTDNIRPPIMADFNPESRNFIVISASDIRIYSGQSGQLLKIFSDIIDSRSGADLKCFAFDSRNRKIILGDAEGTVFALNLSNGVKIMTFSNRNDAKFRAQRAASFNKDKNREINGIFVLKNFQVDRDTSRNQEMAEIEGASIILTSQWNNKIKVYNEKENRPDDQPDENPYTFEAEDDLEEVADSKDLMKNPSKRVKFPAESAKKYSDTDLVMKKLNGKALGSTVVITAVSQEQHLVATGNQQGFVMIWDLESCKTNQVHCASKERITFLEFLEGFPILVAGGADGVITLWATKRASKLQYECLGRFINHLDKTFLAPHSQTQEIDGISCGALKVLRVSDSNKIFKSDEIVFNQGNFTPFCYNPSTKNLYAEHLVGAQQNDKNLNNSNKNQSQAGFGKSAKKVDFASQDSQSKCSSTEEKLDLDQEPDWSKTTEVILKDKIKRRFSMHFDCQKKRKKKNSKTFGETLGVYHHRAIAVVCTEGGFIKLLDLTYITEDSNAKIQSKKEIFQRIGNMVKTMNQFPKLASQNTNKAGGNKVDSVLTQKIKNYVPSIPSFEQIRRAKLQHKKVFFNPLRRIRTNIDKLNADSFLEIAHRRDLLDVDPESFVDCGAITVVNQHHNSDQFFDSHQASNIERFELEKQGVESVLIGLESFNREQEGSQKGSEAETLISEVDVNHTVKFDSPVHQEYKVSCVFKAHDESVTSIKVVDQGDVVSFVTTSSDFMVKIFSLQVTKDGPIHVEQLGGFDIKNPSNNVTPWKFPFDNSDNIMQAKGSFKTVLKQVVAAEYNHRANRKEKVVADPERQAAKVVDNLRIQVIDPDKEKVVKQKELQEAKKIQLYNEQKILDHQQTFMDREKLALKLEKMKNAKIQAQLKGLQASKSVKLLGMDVSSSYQPNLKSSAAFTQRDDKIMDINIPTKMNTSGVWAQKTSRSPLKTDRLPKIKNKENKIEENLSAQQQITQAMHLLYNHQRKKQSQRALENELHHLDQLDKVLKQDGLAQTNCFGNQGISKSFKKFPNNNFEQEKSNSVDKSNKKVDTVKEETGSDTYFSSHSSVWKAKEAQRRQTLVKNHSHSPNQLMTAENQLRANRMLTSLGRNCGTLKRPETELKEGIYQRRDGISLRLKPPVPTNQKEKSNLTTLKSKVITSKLKSNFDLQVKSKFDNNKSKGPGISPTASIHSNARYRQRSALGKSRFKPSVKIEEQPVDDWIEKYKLSLKDAIKVTDDLARQSFEKGQSFEKNPRTQRYYRLGSPFIDQEKQTQDSTTNATKTKETRRKSNVILSTLSSKLLENKTNFSQTISKKLDKQGGNPLLLNPKVRKKRSGFIAKMAKQKQESHLARDASKKIQVHLEFFNEVVNDELNDQHSKGALKGATARSSKQRMLSMKESVQSYKKSIDKM